MLHRTSILGILLAALAPVAACASDGSAEDRALDREALSTRLAAVAEGNAFPAPELRRFYEAREGRPAWIGVTGPTRAAESLLAALGRARREGLEPADYASAELRERFERVDAKAPSREARIDLELDLTRAALRYADHLAHGRVGPEQLSHPWAAQPREVDLVAPLLAIASGGGAEALLSVAPQGPEYQQLRKALGRYLDIAESGGWPEIGRDVVLEPGERADAALLERLAKRLEREGFAVRGTPGQPDAAGQLAYTPELAAALEDFQRDRGIVPDGVLGPQTLGELDRTADDRVRQIALNLERWRWVSVPPEPRHLRVNLPAYELRLVEGGETVIRMKVVVGTQANESPVLSDVIEHVVINPYWNVPASIAQEEILPHVLEDPSWLEARNYEVVEGWDDEAPVRDPHAIDWHSIDFAESSLRFRQKPGPSNALGRIKFLFPNHYHVYLHDTPADHLFERTDRAFSHGCIRVEDPVRLAAQVLKRTEWDAARVREVMQSGERTWVNLPEPLPVHLLYWTAFVNDAGRIEFHQDLYGLDRQLASALDARRTRLARAH